MHRLVRYSSLIVLAAALYTGWVFLDRHWRDQQFQRAVESRKPRIVAPPDYGTKVKIIQFYSSPAVIAPGEKTLLCFGVVNAKKIRIAPGVPEVRPSLNRCLEVEPRRDTEYTIEAEGEAGPPVSQTTKVWVQR